MRTFLIILVFLAVITFFGYRYGKTAISKLDFGSPKFSGIDLLNVLNTSGFSQVNLSTVITNQNNFAIPVNNLYLEVSYLGNLVGKSTNTGTSFVIPANGQITISQNVTISLANSLGIAAKLVAKQPIQFDYLVKATLFNFFPLTFRSNFIYP